MCPPILTGPGFPTAPLQLSWSLSLYQFPSLLPFVSFSLSRECLQLQASWEGLRPCARLSQLISLAEVSDKVMSVLGKVRALGPWTLLTFRLCLRSQEHSHSQASQPRVMVHVGGSWWEDKEQRNFPPPYVFPLYQEDLSYFHK